MRVSALLSSSANLDRAAMKIRIKAYRHTFSPLCSFAYTNITNELPAKVPPTPNKCSAVLRVFVEPPTFYILDVSALAK